MTVVVGALVGFLAGRLIWLSLKPSWQRKALMRQNFSGVTLPTAGGVVILLAVILVEAGRALAGAFGIGDEPALSASRAAVLVLVGGFAFLGLLDDLAGREDVRGLAGHVRALVKGELTSGGMKLIAGLGLSLVAAAMVSDGSGAMLVVEALVIALAANVANLFDLRPGRMAKVSITAFVVVAVAAGFGASLVPVAIAVGAAAALVLDDLHERVMMGDTGANALGAVIGLGIVSEFGATGVLVSFAILLGLNVLSEFVSFSKLIESVPPLRAIDMAGRRRPKPASGRDDADPFGDPTTKSPMASSREPGSRATVGGASERNVPYEGDTLDRASRDKIDSTERIDLRDPERQHSEARPDRGDHW